MDAHTKERQAAAQVQTARAEGQARQTQLGLTQSPSNKHKEDQDQEAACVTEEHATNMQTTKVQPAAAAQMSSAGGHQHLMLQSCSESSTASRQASFEISRVKSEKVCLYGCEYFVDVQHKLNGCYDPCV